MKRYLSLAFTIPITLLITLFYTLAKTQGGMYFHGWANVLLWCCIGAGFILSLFLGMRARNQMDNLSFATAWPLAFKVFSVVGGILFFLFGILHLINGLELSIHAKSATLFPISYIGLGFLFMAGSVYCGLSPLPNSTRQARDALFGMAIPLACIIRVLQLYFEVSSPRNSSVKLLLSLTYLLLALFFISDIRTTLGRTSVGYHFTIAPFAAMVSGGVALGEWISSLAAGTAPIHGWADLLFLAISFLLIIYKGCFITATPISTPTFQENEDTDIA